MVNNLPPPSLPLGTATFPAALIDNTLAYQKGQVPGSDTSQLTPTAQQQLTLRHSNPSPQIYFPTF